MRFPNAFNGVKKIFLAEILGLIGSVVILIGGVIAAAGAAAAVAGGMAGSGDVGGAGLVAAGAGVIFSVIGMIVGVVAFIINIVGINAAKADEVSFSNALIWVIAGIVLTVINVFTSQVAVLGTIISVLIVVANCLVTYFVVQGIVALANQMQNTDVANSGNSLLKVIIVLYAIEAVVTLIGGFASDLASVLSIVTTILGIVVLVLYLMLLSKAKNMLAA